MRYGAEYLDASGCVGWVGGCHRFRPRVQLELAVGEPDIGPEDWLGKDLVQPGWMSASTSWWWRISRGKEDVHQMYRRLWPRYTLRLPEIPIMAGCVHLQYQFGNLMDPTGGWAGADGPLPRRHTTPCCPAVPHIPDYTASVYKVTIAPTSTHQAWKPPTDSDRTPLQAHRRFLHPGPVHRRVVRALGLRWPPPSTTTTRAADPQPDSPILLYCDPGMMTRCGPRT